MVKFLSEESGRTMAQAAIKFCLAQATIVSVLPNLTSIDTMVEYSKAPDTPDITTEEANRLLYLSENNFFVEESLTTAYDISDR